MSWKESILSDFTIQTGDGVVYNVLANTHSKTISWNHDVFSFIGVKGQLGKKEQQLARQFPLEFYFQGADHLATANDFESSLDNKNPCVISHPLYGNITCYLFSVTFSNSKDELNVTKITATAIETLTEQGLLGYNPAIKISTLQLQVTATAIPEITDYPIVVADGTQLVIDSLGNKKNGLKIITIPDEANQYTNVFNQAITGINVITATPILAMGALCNFITMPAAFTALVGDRLNFLESQLFKMLSTVGINVSPTKKKLFEIQASACVSAMCLAATTPLGPEYRTTRDVLNIANRVQANFNTFISTLDGLQVSSGGIKEYYIYSSGVYFALADCVNLTLSKLILIALSGKQERFVYTTEDSNAILLANKYYGGDIDDNNLQYFIDTNNFTYQQMIHIPKGTKIVYYI